MIEFKAYIDGAETGGLKFACTSCLGDVKGLEALDRMHRRFFGGEPLDTEAFQISPMFILALVMMGYTESRLTVENFPIFVKDDEELDGKRCVGQEPVSIDLTVTLKLPEPPVD